MLDRLAHTIDVNLSTSISKDIDSIDVAKMSKGSVLTVHSSLTSTTTSAEVDCRGYNSILVQVTQTGTGTWTYSIQGSLISGATFFDCYEQTNTGSMMQMSYSGVTSSRMFLFKGIPDYIKVVATETVDGATVSVQVQPLNM